MKAELRKSLGSVRYSLQTARNVAEPVYVENEYLREALDALHAAVQGLADIVERLTDEGAAAYRPSLRPRVAASEMRATSQLGRPWKAASWPGLHPSRRAPTSKSCRGTAGETRCT